MDRHFPVPQYAKGHEDDYNGSVLLKTAIVMLCLAPTAVFLRFVSRLLTLVPLMADDWLILAALPFAVTECAIDIVGPINNNFGRHLQYSTPTTLLRFLKYVFSFEIIYNFSIVLPKLSIAALYWRVFGLSSFKWPLITTTALTIIFFIACQLTAIFGCDPVSNYWERRPDGHCIDRFKYYIAQAACNITLDIVLMLLPIIPIRRLQMSLSQKVAVFGIFFLGVFVTLCSGLRLNKLITTQEEAAVDPTYALVDAAVWSVIENNLSVVCVCLPSMRPLLRAILHGSMRSSIRSSYGKHSGVRRSYFDSTVAANSQRRSQADELSRHGAINREEQTDVTVADSGNDLELGYYATVTAGNGKDRKEKAIGSEGGGFEHGRKVSSASNRLYNSQNRTKSSNSLNRLAMGRVSDESIEGRKQTPTRWPLGSEMVKDKDFD